MITQFKAIINDACYVTIKLSSLINFLEKKHRYYIPESQVAWDCIQNKNVLF